MRLIDAEALKERFLSESDRFNCDRWDISAILDEIQDAPAITVKSFEKHGKWEFVEHFAPYQRCSQCSFELPMAASEREIKISLFPYCPNCGARMDMKP